jgi:hypothetical protein
MNVEITKVTETKETIDVALPFYYKHDLQLDTSDAVIYGKIGAM